MSDAAPANQGPADTSGGKALRVEAVVSGRLVASSRFRVLQHVAALGALGVDVHVRPPRLSKYTFLPARVRRHGWLVPVARAGLTSAKLATRLPEVVRSWRADLTWLEREVLPGSLTLEPLLHRPLLFDVDDAIWRLPGHERAVRSIAARSACVVAGNDFLAEWFSPVAAHVERVWTAVDTDRFVPAPADAGTTHDFVIGWTGTSSTMRYLERLAVPLARVLAAVPEARVVVMADLPPALPGVPRHRWEFVRWTPEVEATVLQRFAVGLMPLPDTDWGRGKCAFKMLQYLACGVPAVVSPVGMGAQVLDMAEVGLAADGDDAWAEALLALRADRRGARAMGATGRELVQERVSVPVVAAQLAACMRRHA